MKYASPLLKKDFVETMALWPIVRWTVPRLGIAYAWAFPFLPMCRHFQRLAYQSGSFLQFSVHMGPYFVARAPNLLDVPASGRKETHASPIYFWWRRFGEPSRNSSRVAALADCWRFRSVVVGGSGDSSYLNPSEPNLQKANGRKYRKGKDYKANNTEAKIVRKKQVLCQILGC